jgi:hypothetical protein
MGALLITFLVALVLSVGGTIISLLLFAHGSEHVSHQRSARRVSLVPRSYITNTNLASVVILLVVLGSFIYSAFHVLVAH